MTAEFTEESDRLPSDLAFRGIRSERWVLERYRKGGNQIRRLSCMRKGFIADAVTIAGGKRDPVLVAEAPERPGGDPGSCMSTSRSFLYAARLRELDNADAVEWKTRLDAEIPTRCLAPVCCFRSLSALYTQSKMRTATAIAACAALLAAAPSAFAQLATMRGTIPGQCRLHIPLSHPLANPDCASTGSLHQCEDTTVFFFDSGNASPKTLVLLPQGQGPSGDTTLADVEAIGPLQVIGDITTPDAQSFPFTLQIAAGVSFDVSGLFVLSP